MLQTKNYLAILKITNKTNIEKVLEKRCNLSAQEKIIISL
jgi:hypothetical protein